MSAFALKLIASACMLVDHIGAVIPNTHWILRCIGRIAFPIYAFLIAEGCSRTRDINKYMLRLGAFALISQLPFSLALVKEISFIRSTNIFYTLFLGVACVNIYEKLQLKKNPLYALIPLVPLIAISIFLHGNVLAGLSYNLREAALLAVYAVYAICMLVMSILLPDAPDKSDASLPLKALSLLYALPLIYLGYLLSTDYGEFGVAFILLLYLAKTKYIRIPVLAAGIVYLYEQPFDELLTGRINLLTIFALLSVVLVFFYNGKRGPKLKWVFYCFYPAHLAALALIAYFI